MIDLVLFLLKNLEGVSINSIGSINILASAPNMEILKPLQNGGLSVSFYGKGYTFGGKIYSITQMVNGKFVKWIPDEYKTKVDWNASIYSVFRTATPSSKELTGEASPLISLPKMEEMVKRYEAEKKLIAEEELIRKMDKALKTNTVKGHVELRADDESYYSKTNKELYEELKRLAEQYKTKTAS